MFRQGTYIRFGCKATLSLYNVCNVAVAVPLAVGLEAVDACLECYLGVFRDFGPVRVGEDAVD